MLRRSSDIGLTRSAKELNHYCAITVTARSRVVGLCHKSVDASSDSCVKPFDKSTDNLFEGHAQQGKMKAREKGQVEFSHL